MTSKTWAAMSDEQRDTKRGQIRKLVGNLMSIRSKLDPGTLSIAKTLDVLLLEDRIELAAGISFMVAFDMDGAADEGIDALQAVEFRRKGIKAMSPFGLN